MNRRRPYTMLLWSLMLVALCFGARGLALAQGSDGATSPALQTQAPAEPAAADATLVATAEAAAAATAEASPAPKGADWNKILEFAGRFHEVMIHFPIALLLAAAFGEFLGFFFPAGAMSASARYCLWLAVAGACIAVPLGWAAASQSGFTAQEIFWHRWMGTSTGILSILTLIACELSRRPSRRGLRFLYRAMLFAAAILVFITAHLGGLMVNGPDYFTYS